MLSYEVSRPDTIQHRKHGSICHVFRHVPVWGCLLAMLMQLVLPVIHLWDMPREALSAARLVWQWHSAAPETTAHWTVSDHGLETGRHEALLCPVCQTLARAYSHRAPQGVGLVLAQAHDAWPLPCIFVPYTLLTAIFVPRAPPFAS